MATKKEILDYIQTAAEQKIVTREELNAAYDAGNILSEDVPPPIKTDTVSVYPFQPTDRFSKKYPSSEFLMLLPNKSFLSSSAFLLRHFSFLIPLLF